MLHHINQLLRDHTLIPIQRDPNIIFCSLTLTDLERSVCSDARDIDGRLAWYRRYLRHEIGSEKISFKSRRADSYIYSHQQELFERPRDLSPIVVFTVSSTAFIQAEGQEFITIDHHAQLYMIGGFESLRYLRKIPTSHRHILIPVLIYQNLSPSRARELSKSYRRPASPPRQSLAIMSAEEASDPISKYTYELIERNDSLKARVAYKRQLKQSSEYLFTFNGVRRLVTCAMFGLSGFQVKPEVTKLPDVKAQIDLEQIIFYGCRSLLNEVIRYLDEHRSPRLNTSSSSLLLPTQLMLGVLGVRLNPNHDGQLSLFPITDYKEFLESRLSEIRRLIYSINWYAESPDDAPRWSGIAGRHGKRIFSPYGIRRAGYNCYQALNVPSSILGMRVRGVDALIASHYQHRYELKLINNLTRRSLVNAYSHVERLEAMIISDLTYLELYDDLRGEERLVIIVAEEDSREEISAEEVLSRVVFDGLNSLLTSRLDQAIKEYFAEEGELPSEDDLRELLFNVSTPHRS